LKKKREESMSVTSQKRRKAKRAGLPVPPKSEKVVAPGEKKPKLSLIKLLAKQRDKKNRKKVFRHERRQQKPILELAKRKAEKAKKSAEEKAE
jgi:hypothetical protein